MRKASGVVFILVASLLLNGSCRRDSEILDEYEADPLLNNLSFNPPSNWPAPVYNMTGNPLTKPGFVLGRALFYDPLLSQDNTISCGSCHQQFVAFAHADHVVSHGVDGLLGTRNAPGIFNAAWHKSFMWDGGVNHIEVMPLAPITNPVEMDETMERVVAKLSGNLAYKHLFKDAFGDELINTRRIFLALTQFMSAMISDQSKYDQVMRGKESFTSDEQDGYKVFQRKCASCHTEPLFSDFTYRSNGLPVNELYNDSGRAHITESGSDRYRFKVPSLRNVEVTKPYMHDGRFESLIDVLNHYDSGVSASTQPDTLLAEGIPLTEAEKSDLISFLNTLTDMAFLKDKKFNEPRLPR